MKKLIYKGLYKVTSLISNRFNIRMLTKLKLYLGTALLAFVNSCIKIDDEKNGDEKIDDKKNREDLFVTCYLVGRSQDSE